MDLYTRMYVFVPQVVIKTSRCRLWSRRFELTCFRKLPGMLSTVAAVSRRGGSERSSDKDLDPQALPFSRAVCGGRFHVSGPWEECSFPYISPGQEISMLSPRTGYSV